MCFRMIIQTIKKVFTTYFCQKKNEKYEGLKVLFRKDIVIFPACPKCVIMFELSDNVLFTLKTRIGF